MRRGFMLASTLCALALAACGGGSRTSTSSTVVSASDTSTTASSTAARSSGGVTTVARAPTKRGASTAPAEHHGLIPTVSVVCRNLPQPAAGPAGALRLRDGLQPSIDSLSAFVAQPAAGGVALSERLRAASVLRAMRGAQSAAARYVTSPTSANQKALSAAVLLEGSTAQAETLQACTIPGA